MNYSSLFLFSIEPLWRKYLRWSILREQRHVARQLEMIAAQDENNRHAKRMLQGRQAVLTSELHSL